MSVSRHYVLAAGGTGGHMIPAYALGGELSSDAGERRLIAVMRNMGNQLVILSVPVIAFAAFFVETPGFARAQLNPAPYAPFGLFVSLLGGTLMLIGALGTLRAGRRVEAADVAARQAETTIEGGILRAFWEAIRITPNIGRLLCVAFLVLFVNSVINQFNLHLSTYFWKLDHTWTPTVQVGATLGTLLAMFLAAPFIGLAYAVSLPFDGMAFLAWTAGKALLAMPVAKKALTVLGYAAKMIAAPFVGLAFAVMLPLIGTFMLLWVAGKALASTESA